MPTLEYWKKSFWKNEKNGKSKTRKPREYYSEFYHFRVFDFVLQPSRKLGFKNLGKTFPRFPIFPSFLSVRTSRCLYHSEELFLLVFISKESLFMTIENTSKVEVLWVFEIGVKPHYCTNVGFFLGLFWMKYFEL